MAQFQASLIDPTTQEASVIKNADCTQIQITDSSNYLQFLALQGTIAVTNLSTTINGTGTLFTNLAPGEIVSIEGVSYVINVITSNILMTITLPYQGVSAIGIPYLVEEANGLHDLADFDEYIRIEVEYQSSPAYVFTNVIDPVTGLVDGDEIMPTPFVSQNAFVNYVPTNGDGVYKIRLYSVPTYRTGTYASGDAVIESGVLYKSNSNNNNAIPSSSSNKWDIVLLPIDLPAKYCTLTRVALICELTECLKESTIKAFCDIREHLCDDAILCKNDDFLKSMKMIVLGVSVNNMNERGAYDEIEEAIRLGKSLCKCC